MEAIQPLYVIGNNHKRVFYIKFHNFVEILLFTDQPQSYVEPERLWNYLSQIPAIMSRPAG